jgi:murein DD-endopeptidase MepM/ murein hydrolase activator NlpD
MVVAVAACNSEKAPTGPSVAPALACQGYGPQASSLYILPYPPGASYSVIQGNCSQGPTHIAGGVFKYGYDFGMDIGTSIYASRPGIVIGVDERNTDFNGANAAANYVWVRHDDGTVGRYWHLTRNGALVNVMQRVAAGDLIALSGATGLDRAPHLHFDEAECGPNTCQSAPVTFRNTRAHPNGLQQGESYMAQ